ncbi:MAG: beta strand repeat-containing protein [Janthinobacterium lividum]
MTDYPVSSGQTVTGFQLAGGDTQTVSSGGSIISTNASGPISEYDLSNLPSTTYPGVPQGFYAGPGGEVILNGGDSTGTTLNEGTESIYAGGVSDGTTVGTVIQEGNPGGYQPVVAGSTQNIHSGGVANNSLVRNGTETVMDGGISNNAILISSSTDNGAVGTNIFFGATQAILSGGIASGTTLNGGSSAVSAGGTANATTINYLGKQSVSGSATNTVINTGGTDFIASGGMTTDTLVNGAAPFTYVPNSHYYFITQTVPGGLNVQTGGNANRITVEGGGHVDDFGGVGNTTLTGTSSLLTIEAEANASLTSVTGGATEIDYGSDFEVQVGQGGTVSIMASGSIQGVTIAAGGSLSVASGGSLTPAMFLGINDDGLLSNAGGISLGGFHGDGNGDLSVSSTGMLANSGVIDIKGGTYQRVGSNAIPGVLTVSSGGTIVNTGTLTAEAGTTILPQLPLPSSLLEIAAGAVLINAGTLSAAGSVSVAGTLVLDPGQVTTGIVQGSAGGTLELASGTGTLAGLGSTFVGFNTIRVDAGSNWTLAGATTLAANETINLEAGSTLSVISGDYSTINLPGTINFADAATAIIDLPYGAGPSANVSNFLPNEGLFIANLSVNPSNVIQVTNDDINFSIVRGPNLNIRVGNLQNGNFAFSNSSNGLEIALEPAITALVAHPDKPGVLSVGSAITFDLTPQVALTANTTGGLPTLSLSDGGTATYDQVASTSTNLVFRTTVAAGQNATDLKVTGLALGGGSLVDAIGTIVDGSTVAPLAGSDTGLVIDTTVAPPVTPTPPTTVTGGVTVIGGAGATVFITPKAGSNTVTATATGNDTVISQGSDTIQAGGGADVVYATGTAATVAGGTGSLTFEGGSGSYMVVGGSGSSAIYGGSGSDTFFGGTGSSILVAGSGASNLLLAGVGNTSLVGGLGKAVMMFGGPGADSFVGSSGGNDIMVGGVGGNSFSLTNGDVAFGGPIKADTFTAENGTATITTGGGGAQVNLGSGTLTSFEGSGAVNYNAGKGEGGTTDIVGFTVHDHITLTGGFTAQDASTAFTTATKGSFGTTLNLTDGTKITVFGVNLTATQVSVG